MNKEISQLIAYGLHHNFLLKDDVPYAVNKILDLLKLDEYIPAFDNSVVPSEPSELLKPLLDYAASKELFQPNTITQRDIFEAKIIDALLPRPTELNNEFQWYLKHRGSKAATDRFYDISQKSNYIKTTRTNKNILWKSQTKYGELDITINLSKPEKDPRDIIKAGKSTHRIYPKCLLCLDNVGYNGATTNVGRTSHRVIPLNLNSEPFYLQYSPYVYYNEHCIVFHEEHIPMNVTIDTFKRLFDFVDLFPHYFLGSNAGLPIVGGSILSHEHYQGGAHSFPIEKAKVLSEIKVNEITIKKLYWPLSVLRLESKDKQKLIEAASTLYEYWENYSNEEIGILAYTDAPHNAITPIARKNEDTYILDMTLRNNRTSDEYPLGIFHPHQEEHNIKKENIGLIEVMGLAVLPARLAQELPLVKEALLGKPLKEEAIIHQKWVTKLQKEYNKEDIDIFVQDQVALSFMRCIEHAGVFKQTETSQRHFDEFIKGYIHVLRD